MEMILGYLTAPSQKGHSGRPELSTALGELEKEVPGSDSII